MLFAVNLNMVADTVICDPELTLSLPSGLTAATGIDAMSHGVETTLSMMINPPAAAIALDCVQRAARWLPVAVQDGSKQAGSLGDDDGRARRRHVPAEVAGQRPLRFQHLWANTTIIMEH